MEGFFADDSVQKATRKGPAVCSARGESLLNEQEFLRLEREIDAICGAMGIPAGTELKWSPLGTTGSGITSSGPLGRRAIGRPWRRHTDMWRAVVVWDESKYSTVDLPS